MASETEVIPTKLDAYEKESKLIEPAASVVIARVASDATMLEEEEEDVEIKVKAIHEIGEVLFLCSIGNLPRVQQAVAKGCIDLSSDSASDYDKRTALHIAADCGSYAVAEWLIHQGAPVNALDRFNLTPLASAARSHRSELVKLLQGHGGRVLGEEGELVEMSDDPMFDPMDYLSLSISDWEISKSRIERSKVIGKGQYGEVFMARWNGTICVSKTIKEADLSSETIMSEFRSEINLQQRLHHPNILQFFGVVMKPPIQIIVEYMDGGSLKDAFSKDSCFSRKKALHVSIEVAKGLVYLHAREPKPIIHRDIKPANLLLKKSGEVKIADFGLSRTLKKGQSEAYTLTGETGTYRYMAPEVFKHEPYDTSVDVYAFAMVMYQCFTWQSPFVGIEGVAACRLACEGNRPNLGIYDFPKGLNDMLSAAWATDPLKRLTAVQVLQQLKTLQEQMEAKDTRVIPCCTVS